MSVISQYLDLYMSKMVSLIHRSLECFGPSLNFLWSKNNVLLNAFTTVSIIDAFWDFIPCLYSDMHLWIASFLVACSSNIFFSCMNSYENLVFCFHQDCIKQITLMFYNQLDPWSRTIESIAVTWLVKKFSTFYRTQRFVIFKRPLLSPISAMCNKPTPSRCVAKICFNVII